MPLTSREKNGNCLLYEHILLASKEMALTTGKSTLQRKKCIFEAGTQPAFSFRKSHKWNQNSCGGNMKLCIRRLGFLIPHLILSTFHAGIRKIFLRLVLVNSPHLFCFFPLSSFLHLSPLDFFQWHICCSKAVVLRKIVIWSPLRYAMEAAPHSELGPDLGMCGRPPIHTVGVVWWTSGRSGEQQPIQVTFDAPMSSAALPALASWWKFCNEIRIVKALCVSEICWRWKGRAEAPEMGQVLQSACNTSRPKN